MYVRLTLLGVACTKHFRPLRRGAKGSVKLVNTGLTLSLLAQIILAPVYPQHERFALSGDLAVLCAPSEPTDGWRTEDDRR